MAAVEMTRPAYYSCKCNPFGPLNWRPRSANTINIPKVFAVLLILCLLEWMHLRWTPKNLPAWINCKCLNRFQAMMAFYRSYSRCRSYHKWYSVNVRLVEGCCLCADYAGWFRLWLRDHIYRDGPLPHGDIQVPETTDRIKSNE